MANKQKNTSHGSSAIPFITVAEVTTTTAADTTPKTIRVDTNALRRAQNEELLKNANVKAFLAAIAWAEGGNYHAKFGYGWAKGDWSFK